MNFRSQQATIDGTVQVPGSKSHTIRGLLLALRAQGTSELHNPLYSSDTLSGCAMVEALGATVERDGALWKVQGIGAGQKVPDDIIDVGNSGTSLYLGMSMAALSEGYTVFTGDAQIRRRPADKLAHSLQDLGAEVVSTRGNGCAPLVIRGPLKGGRTSIEAVTSQYLSSLLLAAPFGAGRVEIDVPLLNEKPYVTMTLAWMDRLGLAYRNDNYERFVVEPDQTIEPFTADIAADFSTATFFMVAAAVTGGTVTMKGLDMEDSQGDKQVLAILEEMGARVSYGERQVTLQGGNLKGGEFDLNEIPDALPALSVAATFAEGETRLVNVPQARLKETDRIAVMASELSSLGGDVEERPDGLIIRPSQLNGGTVRGHDDHRVIMSLAIAGMAASGDVVVKGADAVAVTFPEFMTLMNGIGARIYEE